MDTFVALGRLITVHLELLSTITPGGLGSAVAARRVRPEPTPTIETASFIRSLRRSETLSSRFDEAESLALVMPARSTRGPARPAAPAAGRVQTVATPTVIAEGMRQADLHAARDFGARIIAEGLDGKMLLRVDTAHRAFELAQMLQQREIGAVAPNFLRRIRRLEAPEDPGAPWALEKIGVSHAWKKTKGSSQVRIAILDEGVDTGHKGLKKAVVAERDFIGDQGNSARPDGDDAHGTCCAGIALSRHRDYPGIAPRCSLIAARIAMDDGTGSWIFDDFATADAIDWCWRQGAAVLSNSWGGGTPSDPIIRAFSRARTQGRGGRGSVVVVAAGNDQGPIEFPGTVRGVVTVGASNPADERKTKTSSDGEYWWGSCYGSTLSLLAPGVFCHTTDITGPHGYEDGDFTKTFNGTSAAAPHVAGAAALMLTRNPELSASEVRRILRNTAKKLKGQKGWTRQLGYGRLDVRAAVDAVH